jgi:hypothetical protein
MLVTFRVDLVRAHNTFAFMSYGRLGVDLCVLNLRNFHQEGMYLLYGRTAVLRYDIHIYIMQSIKTTSNSKIHSINCSYNFLSTRNNVSDYFHFHRRKLYNRLLAQCHPHPSPTTSCISNNSSFLVIILPLSSVDLLCRD